VIKIKNNKVRIFLIFLIICFSFSIAVNVASACANGPNYWGDGFPGHLVNKVHYYQHPKEPSEYIFGRAEPIPNTNGYDGSHYGTHDWIADSALRSLRDPLKNPLGFSDWAWLLNSDNARNRWPFWRPYISSTNHHEVVRSYMTFVFASQMPDMRVRSDMNDERRSHYPQQIHIPNEGVIIEDFHPQTKNKNKWVGQIQQHNYHFNVLNKGNGIFDFTPYKTLSAVKAKQLGEAAVNCIGNKIEDEEGNFESAMQPEGASGWLGAMTHYIADLAVPAHLLEAQFYTHVYDNDYHDWFENQLASLTMWDKLSHGGPEKVFFNWDISIIGKTGMIIPIPPDIAVASMAKQTIKVAFRTDGNHQHIEFNGDNDEQARKSGLYLDKKEKHWDWKLDIETNGITESQHKYFYSKVEKLLCWATYYTACAMQYCINEGKKKTEDTPGLNPDYWVRTPDDDIPREHPDPDAEDSKDDLEGGSTDSSHDRISRIFRNLGISISWFLLGIADMLRKTFFLIGR
jgi:hypothetical protein